MTLGETIPITDFRVRRLAEGWKARWFRFRLGAGIASGAGGSLTLHSSASVSPLVLSKGRTRLDLLRLDVDRYRTALELIKWSN